MKSASRLYHRSFPADHAPTHNEQPPRLVGHFASLASDSRDGRHVIASSVARPRRAQDAEDDARVLRGAPPVPAKKKCTTAGNSSWSLRRSFQSGSRNRAVKGRSARVVFPITSAAACPLDRALVGCPHRRASAERPLRRLVELISRSIDTNVWIKPTSSKSKLGTKRSAAVAEARKRTASSCAGRASSTARISCRSSISTGHSRNGWSAYRCPAVSRLAALTLPA